MSTEMYAPVRIALLAYALLPGPEYDPCVLGIIEIFVKRKTCCAASENSYFTYFYLLSSSNTNVFRYYLYLCKT